MARQALTVLIPTYNSELHLRPCLESVKWADEIFIVDSFSTDSTLAIAREYTDRIVQHDYVNSATQKNWAIPQARYDWILIIDSDEFLDLELQQEIQNLLEDIPNSYDGFRIRFKNLVFGKWIKTGNMYPCYNTRLFRRDVARYEQKEVHADVVVPSKVGELKGHFIHHDFEDVEIQVRKWSRYIRWEGERMLRTGRNIHWYDPVFRPPAVFIWYYFGRGGIKEGFRGFYVSTLWSFYTFLKWARLWELHWRNTEHGQKYWNHDYDL